MNDYEKLIEKMNDLTEDFKKATKLAEDFRQVKQVSSSWHDRAFRAEKLLVQKEKDLNKAKEILEDFIRAKNMYCAHGFDGNKLRSVYDNAYEFLRNLNGL